MTKRQSITSIFLALVIAATFLAACAPKQAAGPASAPAAVPAPAASPSIAGKPAVQTPEDEAWAKVIAAARKEGLVTIYSYNFVGDVGIAVSKAFEQKYGIRADIVTGRGAEFLERVKTEQRVKQQYGDFTEGSQVHLMNMKKSGITVSSRDIPSLREKDVWRANPLAYDTDGHLLGYYFSYYGPFVNTNMTKPADEPKAWKDLLDPKYKGKIIMNDVRVSGQAYTVFVPLLNRGILTMDYIRELGKQNMLMNPNVPDAARMLARGEGTIFAVGSTVTLGPMVAEGAPLKPVPMQDGIVGTNVTASVLKGGPHPNAAMLFMNWLLSKEGQDVAARSKNALSVRNDVPDYSPQGIRMNPPKVVIMDAKDDDDMSTMFRDKAFLEFWK
ncbi:MAG: extracellular solute-binding protein [Chloroflexi bacterium]|nr:extracellular solute-binding protein [Chloroflexota bacterium]